MPTAVGAEEEEGRFTVREGYLSASIRKLVQSHDWTLEWKSEEDRIINQPFSVPNETLTDGLNNLLHMYEGKFVADLYYGNKVVLVSPAPHAVEVILPPDDYIGDIRPVSIPQPKIIEKPKVIEKPEEPSTVDDAPAPPPPDDEPQADAAPPEWTEVAPEEEEIDYTGSEVWDLTPIDKSGLDPHSQLLPEPASPTVTMPGSMPDAVFQVASLQEKPKAEDMVNRLLKLGYDARLSEYWRNDQSWYRVRVHVDANEDAEKVKAGLEAHGYSVWVLLPGFSTRD